jgi:hypothetical protein
MVERPAGAAGVDEHRIVGQLPHGAPAARCRDPRRREETEVDVAEPVQREVRVEAPSGTSGRMPTYRSATASRKYS